LSDPRREVRLLLGRLIRGDLASRLGRVDLRGRVGDQRADQTVTALAGGRVRDLREGLPRAKLRFEIGSGQAEVRRRGGLGLTDHVPAAGSAAEASRTGA